MKNTILKDIISNFDLMANDHFIEWFKESKSFMLEREKDQIENAYDAGNNFDGDWSAEEQYYKETFNK